MKIQNITIFFLAIILLLQFSGLTFKNREIFQECQPQNINYQSFDPYCVTVFVEQKMLNKKTVLAISKKIDIYGVRHQLDYPYTIANADKPDIRITWNSDGVEISNSSSFKMNIPKSSFIGGR